MNSQVEQLGRGEETLFRDPLCQPLFVSPKNSAPSEEIVPYLDLLFPNVPERAKQNNVLLKREELNYIEPFLDSQVCSEYDVTIVIDQGACIEDQVRGKLKEIDRKAIVNCAFHCCILTIANRFHNKAALNLFRLILMGLGDWGPIVDSWTATTTLMSGPVSDFYRRFTHFFKSPDVKEDHQAKEADPSFIEIYSESLCRALGMSPVPSLAIESANSDDIRKLFQNCISWLSGSYLRVNTVIVVNNSPETYSVDILNFDSTVDNLLQLANSLDPQHCPVTREALLLSAKMKASVIFLQLRLLQYLLDNPRVHLLPTQEDVDVINGLLAEDIALAQSLCPYLEIKRLDLERFPRLDTVTLVGFAAHITTEIEHYQNILNRQDIRDLGSGLNPRDAIVSASYAIVHHTTPQTFGPISMDFTVPEDSAIQVPRRALCTLMGEGNISFPHHMLGIYFRVLSPEVWMMNVDLCRKHIHLEWISDPDALSNDQSIDLNQLTKENYNPNTTLEGHIKFRYLTLSGLREIARAINAPDVGYIHL